MMIISLISIALFTIIFFSVNKFVQFCIITLSILFPISFGNIGFIKGLLVIEWFTPIFLIYTLNNFLPLRNKGQLINFSGTKIFIAAMVILAVWLIQSYITNQLLTETIGTENQIGIRRMYYGVFSKIFLFFSTVIFLYSNITEIDIEKWLKVIIYFSLIFGIIRIFAYFMNFDTPLLSGTFNYNPRGGTKYGGVAYRIGGLSDVASIGISALVALYYLTKKFNVYATIIFFIVLFLSGGRTVLVGLSVSVVIYSLFFMQKNLLYIVLIVGFTGIIIFLVAPDKLIQGQLGRLSSFQGGVEQQDKGRYMTYRLSLENFMENPIFGKGIREYEGYITATNSKEVSFIRNQLFSGGHGSYITILGTFGIGGILYLGLMVFGGIILSFFKIRDYFYSNPYLAALSTFVFIMLIIKSIIYITEQNGISDPSLFYLTAIVSAIRVLENKDFTSINLAHA